MSDWHRVCAAADVRPGALLGVRIGDRDVVLCGTPDGVHALDDLCTHADAKMSEGRLRGTRLVCPMHGAGFDCRSGSVLAGPAATGLRTHEVRIEGGYVEVRLS